MNLIRLVKSFHQVDPKYRRNHTVTPLLIYFNIPVDLVDPRTKWWIRWTWIQSPRLFYTYWWTFFAFDSAWSIRAFNDWHVCTVSSRGYLPFGPCTPITPFYINNIIFIYEKDDLINNLDCYLRSRWSNAKEKHIQNKSFFERRSYLPGWPFVPAAPFNISIYITSLIKYNFTHLWSSITWISLGKSVDTYTVDY